MWCLFLAPIAVIPDLFVRWGWPTLLLTVAGAGLAAWCEARGRLSRALVIAIAVFFGVLVVAALAGSAPLPQLWGRMPRYEGAITVPVVVAALWAGARLLGPAATERMVRTSVRAAATSAALLGVVAVMEAFGLRPLSTDLDRPGSLAGQATDQGLLGVLFLAWCGFAALGETRRRGRPSLASIIGCFGAVAALSTSASRAAFLAGMLVVLALAARVVWTARRRLRAAIWAVGVAVVLPIVALLIPLTRARLLAIDPIAGQTIGGRILIWQDALAVWAGAPILGVGPSGYLDTATEHLPAQWWQIAPVASDLDSPHNVVLQIMVAGGIAGLLVAVGLGLLVARSAWSTVRSVTGPRQDLILASAVGLVAGLLVLLTTPTSPKTSVVLALMTGCLVAMSPRARKSITARVLRLGAPAWLVVLIVWTVADGYLLTGLQAAASGSTAAAKDAFQTARALRPWDVDIDLVAAKSLGAALGRGQTAAGGSALQWAQEGLGALPKSSDAYETIGVIRFQLNDWAGARDALASAAALSPVNPRMQHELGLAQYQAGDPVGARASLELATQLAPYSLESWEALEFVCRDLGDQSCVDSAARGAAAATR